jgi:hypothetical protein
MVCAICTIATPSNCGKVLLGFLYRHGIERSAHAHHRETCGYGKNQKDRDNPQPSPKPLAAWMQFRDSMSVGPKGHKIESTPLETRSLKGIYYGTIPWYRRV